jgi:hypothetical protein
LARGRALMKLLLKRTTEYRTAECQKSPRPPLEKGEFQVESLQASPSATTRQVAQSFIEWTVRHKSSRQAEYIIRCSMLTVRRRRIGRSTCPQCLNGGVRPIDMIYIPMLEPTKCYAWQAGVRRSIVSFPIRPAVFLAGGGAET